MSKFSRKYSALLSLVLTTLVLSGCELEEVTVVEVNEVVIAEIYLDITSDPGGNIARAFLHRTVGLGGVDTLPSLTESTVTMTRNDGYSFVLTAEATDECLESSPLEEPGACFVSELPVTSIGPGDIVEVRVELPGGGRITGASRVPGDFEVSSIPTLCVLAPNTLMTVTWSSSSEAWAYLNETSIRGLPEALRGSGVEVTDDPLYLLGLSISDSDTTVVFPSEFGIFNRFTSGYADLARRLQTGLPLGVTAEVSITAVDGNYVNWARGGNFNPSGQVRVPSLSGDGTGVFGTTVGRSFDVLVSNESSGLPACPLS